MNDIQSKVSFFLPANRKQGVHGWISYNCPVCQIQGESRPDTKGRGQIIFSRGGFVIICHNCKFKTGWFPGGLFNKKIATYLEALGADQETIRHLQLDVMKFESEETDEEDHFDWFFKEKKLPDTTKSFSEWASSPNPPAKFLEALNYVNNRNPQLLDLVDFHWSSDQSLRKNGRIIIPVKYHGKILGTTSRWFDGDPDGRPKYINDVPTGMMYNADMLDDPWRKHLILVEGVLDAAAIDAVGLFRNKATEYQLRWLNTTDKIITVLPDKDKAGEVLIDQAIENEWRVSFPEWEEKDAEEAVRKHGRLFVVERILKNAVEGETMIKVRSKSWL